MLDNEKSANLKKCADIIAVIFTAYPFVFLLLGMAGYLSGPVDVKGVVMVAAMTLILPSVIWLTLRYRSAPPGKYPIMDKFVNDRWFRFFTTLGILFVWVLVLCSTSLIKK
jgi:hypothetical protein